MVRYFYSTAAGKPIELEGKVFKFLPIAVHGGRISGVFDTSDEGDIAILVRAAGARIGISEMTQADADKAKKKLTSPHTSVASSRSEPPRLTIQPPLFPVKEGAGSAGSAARPEPVPGENTSPKIISMFRVGKVGSPKPLVAEKDRMLSGRLNK